METTRKPKCELIGQDGNIFNLLGQATRALRKAGLTEEAKELSSKIFDCGSYSEALNLIEQYVEIQ